MFVSKLVAVLVGHWRLLLSFLHFCAVRPSPSSPGVLLGISQRASFFRPVSNLF